MFYVRWGYTDDHGRYWRKYSTLSWFETEQEAEEWKAKMRKNNGDYFHEFETAQGDYQKYLRLQELLKEVAELKQEFGGE